MEELIEKWEEIIVTLRQEFSISNVAYKNWILPLQPDHITGSTLFINIAKGSDFISKNFIEKHYTQPFQVTIEEVTGKELEIIFQIPVEEKTETSLNENKIISPNYSNTGLNPRYTFDSFVEGGNNKFARGAALAVSESPGETYNPLYIYGGPGLGKTHLIHAIGNHILEENPNQHVLYVTCEVFLNEVIESIRYNNGSSQMHEVREKYRSVDTLMIDDIQLLIGKEATQEEFFNTFNALYGAGKQIIITSDRPPKELKTFNERLRTRLGMGLMADIGLPDYETRMAIIRRKMEIEDIELSEEILNYIADNIKSNIREIEGALNKLIAISKISGQELTLDQAMDELQNIISPDKPREITPQLIIEAVAEHYQLSMDQMTSALKSKDVARPRQIAMYLCRKMTEYPLDSIGQLLGGRDHTTIIHGSKKIEEEILKDEELKEQIDRITNKINPN